MQKRILNQMTQAIEVHITSSLDSAMSLGRNDHSHAGITGLLNQGVTVIPSVCNQVVRVYSFDKCTSLSAISSGTFCNKHSDRHAMRIHGQVYF